jgi:MFS family permease
LPVVAAHELGLGAFGYGVLLASMGVGAVGGAAILPRARARLSVDRLAIVFVLIFGAGLFALAVFHNLILLNLVLVFVGAAWLAVNSFLNIAAQTLAPDWVKARVLGVYLLVSQGGLAAGSAVWGLVAGRFGSPVALMVAAGMLIVGIATVRRWPLPSDENLDLSPSHHWPTPELPREPEATAGPVLVMSDYRVATPDQAAFCHAMADIEIIRRRNGATRWGLFHDAADPERFVETFLVSSWAEHLRQHERVTVADKAVEERALSWLKPGTTPVVVHFLAAHDGDDPS